MYYFKTFLIKSEKGRKKINNNSFKNLFLHYTLLLVLVRHIFLKWSFKPLENRFFIKILRHADNRDKPYTLYFSQVVYAL